jgi:serine/threonine protein kinase
LIDFEEKLDIAIQVGLALEYLHSKDIIFRDLKPDNVGLIDRPDGKTIVKLFDFGLCRELPEENPQENKVFHMSGVGTRRYMSPEVFLGQYYNVKADVYSWSMVFHSMLSLQRPFEMYNADLHKLLVCQEGVRPTIYKEWPLQIQELLRKGWAQSPMDRPPMGDICADIALLLGEIETVKDSLSESDEASYQQQRRQTQQNKNAPGTGTFVEQSFANFVDSLTITLCSGSGETGNNNKTKRSKRSLLRTLEAHLVADAAGTQLLMMRDHPHPHFRDRVGADYPQIRHLRSSYL